ncbi:cytochrome b [Consotaella aegiceratis]|uniref:cytochrome b n=1 Tax=Consotaella aegiceratis TaxID=3097961 RepID=UPI002F4181D0
MEDPAPTRSGWSALNVWMHWLIVLLIVVQILDHEAMEEAWHAQMQGTAATADGSYAWLHVAVGILILAFALTRLADRFIRGRPPHPTGEPTWTLWLAKIVHFLLYTLLILMPISGMVAWFGGVGPAGFAHGTMWTILLVLIGLHVLGALAQHFVFKTNVLTRMFKPG